MQAIQGKTHSEIVSDLSTNYGQPISQLNESALKIQSWVRGELARVRYSQMSMKQPSESKNTFQNVKNTSSTDTAPLFSTQAQNPQEIILSQNLYPVALGTRGNLCVIKDNHLFQIDVGVKSIILTEFLLPDAADNNAYIESVAGLIKTQCPSIESRISSTTEHEKITHPVAATRHRHSKFTYTTPQKKSQEQRLTLRSELLNSAKELGFHNVTKMVDSAVNEVRSKYPNIKNGMILDRVKASDNRGNYNQLIASLFNVKI